MSARRAAVLAIYLATFGLIAPMTARAEDEPALKITGALAYRERIALPRDSLAIVEIRPTNAAEDASVLAEQRIELGDRQVPIPFSLEVERTRFAERETYLLRAGILDGLAIRWLSDPVEINPVAESMELGTLLLKSHRAPSPFGIARMDNLVGIEWIVEDIDNGGIIDSSRVTLTLGEDGRVSGRGSCNGYGGSWSETDGALSVSQIVSTQMACAEALMDQEQKFFAILTEVKRLSRSSDGALILHTADGRILKARRGED